MKQPLLTIAIATFNSQSTLPLVLDSLKKQTIDKSEVELLLVDGGSTDNTKLIAKKYGAALIHNPKTEPVHAKYLAYRKAQGRYLMYLDHDEVFENEEVIKKMLNILQTKKLPAIITSGYQNPKNYAFINEYINEFGDPFSFFIYRLSKDKRFFIPTMKKRYEVQDEDTDFITFNCIPNRELPLIELCAAGGIIDRHFFKKHFPETLKNQAYIPHFFYLMTKIKPTISIAKNTTITHYSSDTIKKYLNKIIWRIKNNIFHQETLGNAGFTGRNTYQPMFTRLKKYLFLPYALIIMPVALDSLYLIVSRKNILYTLHVFLTFYTALLILYFYMMKFFGYMPILKSYDESREINV